MSGERETIAKVACMRKKKVVAVVVAVCVCLCRSYIRLSILWVLSDWHLSPLFQNDFPTRMSLVVWSHCGCVMPVGWIPWRGLSGKDAEQQANWASVNLCSHRPGTLFKNCLFHWGSRLPINSTQSQRLWKSARKMRPGLSSAPSILHWKAAMSLQPLQPWTRSKAAFVPLSLSHVQKEACVHTSCSLRLLCSLDQNCLHA